MANQRPIGFWLKLVDRLIDERLAKTLDEHGVTRRQWQLLKEHLAELVDRNRAITADGVSEQQYAQTLETLERMAHNPGWAE